MACNRTPNSPKEGRTTGFKPSAALEPLPPRAPGRHDRRPRNRRRRHERSRMGGAVRPRPQHRKTPHGHRRRPAEDGAVARPHRHRGQQPQRMDPRSHRNLTTLGLTPSRRWARARVKPRSFIVGLTGVTLRDARRLWGFFPLCRSPFLAISRSAGTREAEVGEFRRNAALPLCRR
jgi:hypothetical protein